jgi:hypothetical protein
MRKTREELQELLNLNTAEIVLKDGENEIKTTEYDIYAAIGYMGLSGDDSVSFTTQGTACFPGSPDWDGCLGEG